MSDFWSSISSWLPSVNVGPVTPGNAVNPALWHDLAAGGDMFRRLYGSAPALGMAPAPNPGTPPGVTGTVAMNPGLPKITGYDPYSGAPLPFQPPPPVAPSAPGMAPPTPGGGPDAAIVAAARQAMLARAAAASGDPRGYDASVNRMTGNFGPPGGSPMPPARPVTPTPRPRGALAPSSPPGSPSATPRPAQASPNPRFSTIQYQVPGGGGPASRNPIYTAFNPWGQG